jgi:hypothetical protein
MYSAHSCHHPLRHVGLNSDKRYQTMDLKQMLQVDHNDKNVLSTFKSLAEARQID